MDAAPLRIAVLTKGHPFDGPAFFDVFDSMPGIEWTHVEQPEALTLVEPERSKHFDAYVMYDMPGITFTGAEPPVVFSEPPEGYPEAFHQLLARGKGMVFLHHAIASWPAWPEFADIVGGRFHYQPGELDSVAYPDSGYRHEVTHTIDVLDPEHPICVGVEPTFSITDEVYLYPVLTEAVEPLMRSRHDFVDHGFYSADRAVRGTRNDRTGWSHPPGSNLVAWTKRVENSAIAYLQFGDGPATYVNPNFRTILRNAIRWSVAVTEVANSGTGDH